MKGQKDYTMKKKQSLINIYGIIIVGSALFAGSVNIFIVPLGLYNGGGIGIAQILRSLLVNFLDLKATFDIAGIINLCFNIPLFIIAYKSISHKFFYGTLCSVIVQTICLTLIPIPTTPIINDVMVDLIVGGIVSGIGIGLCLQQGASGGGIDILGMYTSIKLKSFSVGKLSLIINVCIYIICAVLFDISTAIYSVIYATVFSLVLDKLHLQNIAISAMIFTKNKDVKQVIMKELKRGVTYWHGAGAYTDSDTDILVTVISKYEVNTLKKFVLNLDADAFIILSEGLQITGNYEKRLIPPISDNHK